MNIQILLYLLVFFLLLQAVGWFLHTRRHKRQLAILQAQLPKQHFQASLLNILVHDIMNPILAARFSVENLRRHSPSSLHTYVGNALGAIDELNQLVQRVRDLRAYDTGRKRLHYSVVNVNDMLVSLQKTFQDRLHEKGIKISVRHDASASLVEVDPVIFLSNVLNNILDNSIKFSRENTTIELSACSLGDDVEFVIKDQGIGMHEDLVETLFLGLIDNVRATTSGESGTGIGMMQVAKYLNLTGGTVQIESRPESMFPSDHGTTFRIRLPKRQSPHT